MTSDMKKKQRAIPRVIAFLILIAMLTVISTSLRAETGTCGGGSITLPFADVSANNIFFCSIAAAYFSGLTNGTTATTYSPSSEVSREQMAAFITRTQDSALRQGSLRAALDQWVPTKSIAGTARTSVGDAPFLLQSDGADLWVANQWKRHRVAREGKRWAVAVIRESASISAETISHQANCAGRLAGIDAVQSA